MAGVFSVIELKRRGKKCINLFVRKITLLRKKGNYRQKSELRWLSHSNIFVRFLSLIRVRIAAATAWAGRSRPPAPPSPKTIMVASHFPLLSQRIVGQNVLGNDLNSCSVALLNSSHTRAFGSVITRAADRLARWSLSTASRVPQASHDQIYIAKSIS